MLLSVVREVERRGLARAFRRVNAAPASLAARKVAWYERRMRRRSWVAVLAAVAVSTATVRAETLTVFAAASLMDALRTIGKTFEAAHPGTKIEFSFAGSSTLVRQIMEGAPADVFASADEESMEKVRALISSPQIFAGNRLAIIVGKGNPRKVTSLADLAKPGLTIALAAPVVPIGRYAREAFAKAGVAVPASSSEIDVKAVVTRVSMGEADAGVVYTTDVAAAGDVVQGVAIPDAQNVRAKYPIATVKASKNEQGAFAFVRYVLSPEARRILGAVGFLAP
jgi:molybdate transport system substrate-binding protein